MNKKCQKVGDYIAAIMTFIGIVTVILGSWMLVVKEINQHNDRVAAREAQDAKCEAFNSNYRMGNVPVQCLYYFAQYRP